MRLSLPRTLLRLQRPSMLMHSKVDYVNPQAPNAAAVDKVHSNGRLTARERLNILLDDRSFVECDTRVAHRCTNFGMEKNHHPGDSVVTGRGKIFGREVCVFSHDFMVNAGTLSTAQALRVCKIMDEAASIGCPLIGLNESGGARIQEGVDSLAGYSDVFYRNVQLSGVVPQISVIMGACAGGSVYSPALTDFTFMVKNTSRMFITGPDVVRAVTHEEVTADALGGSHVHATKSGVSSGTFNNDVDALIAVRELVSYLPASSAAGQFCPSVPPAFGDSRYRDCSALRRILPDGADDVYNMHDVLERTVDYGSWFEIAPGFARSIITGFARFEGRTVAIIAQQPAVRGGVLDIDSSCKAARFVNFADAFNIPIVTFVDVPGYLPGVTQEHGGIIRHGAKLLFAYAQATTPKITVITRKAYGGAYCVMSSKHFKGDSNMAWPSAEIAVMGARGACNILHRKDAGNAEKMAENVATYDDLFCSPRVAAERGYIDQVIEPENTRLRICEDLDRLVGRKRIVAPTRKLSNIPL